MSSIVDRVILGASTIEDVIRNCSREQDRREAELYFMKAAQSLLLTLENIAPLDPSTAKSLVMRLYEMHSRLIKGIEELGDYSLFVGNIYIQANERAATRATNALEETIGCDVEDITDEVTARFVDDFILCQKKRYFHFSNMVKMRRFLDKKYQFTPGRYAFSREAACGKIAFDIAHLYGKKEMKEEMTEWLEKAVNHLSFVAQCTMSFDPNFSAKSAFYVAVDLDILYKKTESEQYLVMAEDFMRVLEKFSIGISERADTRLYQVRGLLGLLVEKRETCRA